MEGADAYRSNRTINFSRNVPKYNIKKNSIHRKLSPFSFISTVF